MLPGETLIVNPGSVGMPAYTHDEPFPHARYALIEKQEGAWRIEHERRRANVRSQRLDRPRKMDRDRTGPDYYSAQNSRNRLPTQQTGIGETVAILVAADAWYTQFQKTARGFDGLDRDYAG